VWSVCREPLAANGLAIVQTTEHTDDAGVTIVTTLLHTSGQWIATDVRLPIAGTLEGGKVGAPTIQSIGGAITYGRRYGLSALLGVVTDDDDDGNTATNAGRQAERQRREAPAQPARAAAPSGPVVPFGDLKGTPLTQLTDDQLVKLRDWCTAKDDRRAKFADLLADLYEVIESRPALADRPEVSDADY